MAKEKKPVPEPKEKPVNKSLPAGAKPETKIASSDGPKNAIEELYTGLVEQTQRRSGYVRETMKMPYNPDDIYQKKGNYSIYEEMLNDDQVFICSSLKKDLVLGSGYTLVPNDESQIEICKEIQAQLEDANDVSFSDKLREILDAYEMGFSLTEKVFVVLPDGKLGLKDLLTRHPNSWLIWQDPQGHITKFEQKSTIKGDLSINPKSLIHYINNGKYQNPYGKSDLRAAYNAWFVKRQVIRWFGIFLEANAKAIPVARYPDNSPEGTADELLEMIQAFQAKTALVLPEGVEMEFLEAKSNGEAYHKAINLFNMFIGRSMFIPDLLGMSGSETAGGSLALGKEQMNIFFMHINRRRATLEKLVNRHIIKPLCLYNYGDIEIPKFQFNPLDDQQAVELAKIWLEMTKQKLHVVTEEEIAHFLKLVKFPEVDIEIKEEVEPAFDENGQPLHSTDPKHPNNLNQDNKDLKEGDDAEKKEEIDAKDAEKKTEEKPDVEKKFAKVYQLPKGDYHKKVNFKAIENKLNDYDTSLVAEVEPIINKMYDDLAVQLKRKNILNNHDISKVDAINLKYKGEMKKAIKASFLGIFKDGQVQAAAELNKADFKTPTTSEEFLDLLEQETFAWIGKYEYAIKEKVRQEIVAAIKDGLPLSQVLDVMDNEGKKLSKVSLERFARTKHTEVLNRGRHEFFQNSGFVAAYQYSAILDDRTSDICSGLDGKIFVAGTEPIPALHFNCRSTLIPITKYEEFTPTESIRGMDPQDFIQEYKGGGFSQFACDHNVADIDQKVVDVPAKKVDESSDFKTEYPNDTTEVITYFINKKPSEKITITYSDNTRKKIESKTTERIDEKV